MIKNKSKHGYIFKPSLLKCTTAIPTFAFLILLSNTTGLFQEFSLLINMCILVIFLNNLFKSPWLGS